MSKLWGAVKIVSGLTVMVVGNILFYTSMLDMVDEVREEDESSSGSVINILVMDKDDDDDDEAEAVVEAESEILESAVGEEVG